MKTDVFKVFEKDGNKAAEKIAGLAVTDASVLKQVLEGASSENKRIKNASAKCLREISRISPIKLYPHFVFFVRLIDGNDNILKWNAIYVLGDLTDIDTQNKFNTKILSKYFELLRDKSMVTAANTFRTLGKVALNKPKFREKITEQLINVEELSFPSECRNILAGTAIEAFEMFVDEMKDKPARLMLSGKKEIIAFAEKHLNNRRNGTRKKAERFLKHLKDK